MQEIGSDSNEQAEKPVPAVAGEHHLGPLASTFEVHCLVHLLDLALIAVVIAAGKHQYVTALGHSAQRLIISISLGMTHPKQTTLCLQQRQL